MHSTGLLGRYLIIYESLKVRMSHNMTSCQSQISKKSAKAIPAQELSLQSKETKIWSRHTMARLGNLQKQHKKYRDRFSSHLFFLQQKNTVQSTNSLSPWPRGSWYVFWHQPSHRQKMQQRFHQPHCNTNSPPKPMEPCICCISWLHYRRSKKGGK